MEAPIRIRTLSGSLRAKSSNAALLQAVALLAPHGVYVVPYDGLSELPHFNPDLDIDPAPSVVRALRDAITEADALIISSPEYAHGVPGSLKNALDWLVSGVEIYQKPVALLNPSPMSRFAQPQLAEILRTMNVALVEEACLTLPIAGGGLDAAAIAADAGLAEAIRGVFGALGDAVALARRTR
jgi:NAD(P)H-dependent FMN reductase